MAAPEGCSVSPIAETMIGENIPVPELPPELWAIVLARLPVKFLLRLRCVSKTWRSIIDNPNFTRLHLDLRNSKSDNNFVLTWELAPTGLFQSELRILLRTVDDFTVCEEILRSSFSPFRLVYCGYAQGLMLFKGDDYSLNTSGLMLFNPSIRKFMVLPPSPPCDLSGSSLHFLVFDPRSNDHKVLKVQNLRDDSLVFVATFVLGTGCWEVSTQTTLEPQSRWDIMKPVCANGVIHWISYDRSLVSSSENPHVVSFDLGSDEFSYTNLPRDQNGSNEPPITLPFLLGDSFAVFDISDVRVCIWVMTKCGGSSSTTDSWSKWYDGPSDSDTFEFFKKLLSCRILYVQEINKLLLVVNSRKVKSYDLNTHMMRNLENPAGSLIGIIGPYKESLLLAEGVGLQSLAFHPQ